MMAKYTLSYSGINDNLDVEFLLRNENRKFLLTMTQLLKIQGVSEAHVAKAIMHRMDQKRYVAIYTEMPISAIEDIRAQAAG